MTRRRFEYLDVEQPNAWVVVTVYDKEVVRYGEAEVQRIVNVYGPFTTRSRARTMQRQALADIGDRTASAHVRPVTKLADCT